MSTFKIAMIFLVVWSLLIPGILKLFGTKFEWPDIPIAVVPSVALYFIPLVGPVLSAGATVGLLYWRINDRLFPDIVVAVALARLASLPVMMMMSPDIVGS
ncbi:hypothetical protein [Arenimonas sp.]|uniref:hypothetical protein n=1 Tax=Arenimonas sp. TaxID=1872635 RepID=UPI0039E4DB20